MLRRPARLPSLVLLVLSGLLLTGPSGVRGQAADGEEPPKLLSTGTAVLVVDGRETLVPMSETALGPLFALPPIVRQLGGELRPGPGGSAVLKLHDVESILGPGSDVVTRNRTIVELSQPVRSGEGGLHVPVSLLRATLGDLMGYDFVWSPGDRRLLVRSRRRPETEVAWDLVHLQGITTLVLTFPERPRYRLQEEPGRTIVRLLGGERVTARSETRIDDPLLRDLAIGDERIVVTLRPGVVAETYEQSNPFRLVFDLYRRQEAPAEKSVERPGDASDSEGLSVVVIDPGHGGEETGAAGPTGVEEKELTLTLARLLKRRLEARLPVRAILTRQKDVELPLDTRAAIANQNRADLFISIHLNSSLGNSAHGAETYFLSLEASDARAAASATEENRAGDGDPALGDLQLILWDLAQSRHLAESQRFANLVQEELNQALGLRDRGVKQAPFRVLMGAAMPAVLVELGFLSNPEEESKLVQSAYQGRLVDALVRAVIRYRAQLEASGSP